MIWVLDEFGKSAKVASVPRLNCIRILYDSRQGELRLTATRIACTQTTPTVMGSPFCWKDVVYFRVPVFVEVNVSREFRPRINYGKVSTVLHILDIKEGTCREAERASSPNE